ncbi:GerAB/ArcD/ProY family transporter [Paenibacillus ferrarius]|uniref:GerAB/ArcD/ProY family transporter n=1 Tax=Paenibacillus ferrarius TaxID=1469647 RepID=UPI003D26A0C4
MMLQRVSQLELGLLFVLFNFSTGAGFMLGPLSAVSGFQGWMVIIVGHFGGLAIAFLAYQLAIHKPNDFLAHYGKELVGRWLHVAMMVGYCFFFIHIGSIVLRQTMDFLLQIYLPSTPSWAIGGSFAFVIWLAVRSGLEAIFRCAAGFFFVIFVTASFVPFLVGKELNFHSAIALITNFDVSQLAYGSYPFIPWFGEMFLILFIFPFLAEPEKTRRTLVLSSLCSIFFFEVYYLLCILLFDKHLMAEITYPILEMLRFIRIGDFLENLDPIVVAIWIAGLFIKISLLLYVSVLIFAQQFNLKDTRPLSFPFAAIMVGLAMNVVKNQVELNDFLMHSWANFAYCIEFSPIIYWAAFKLRKLWKSKKAPKESVIES